MILLYSRRCLEVIITDLCECELKRPRKTEPLKGIIDKLHKEEKVPSHIISSMHGMNELSTYGAHPKDFDPEQIKPVINNLDIIIKWYLKYKNIVTVDKTEVDEEKIRLRKEPLEEVTIKERTEVQEKPAKAGKHKLLSIVAISTILVIAAILAYPKIFKRDTLERLRSSGERISVAVMPFQNMTNDTNKECIARLDSGYFNNLSFKLRRIKSNANRINKNIIKSKGYYNYASLTPSIANKSHRNWMLISLFMEILNRQVHTIRLNAQLIDSKTEEVFKSFQLRWTSEENNLNIIDSLSIHGKGLSCHIQIKKGNSTRLQEFVSTIKSPEAYQLFYYGQSAFAKRILLLQLICFLRQSLLIQTLLTLSCMLALAYRNQETIRRREKMVS